MFKKYIQARMERYVKKYFRAHPEVKLIVVAGSIGKTSTKNAIATVLGQKYRIGGGIGNHNSELSAPLAILGIKYPEKVKNIFEWLKVLKAAKVRVKSAPTVDIIVQEIAADKPGDIKVFARYLKPDLAVATSVSLEHMMSFKTMEAVAKEEILAINMSKKGLINRDDIDDEYAKYLTNPDIATYGKSEEAENKIIIMNMDIENGLVGKFIGPEIEFDIRAKVYGEHSAYPVIAAVAVGLEFGMTPTEINLGLGNLVPTSGRMNILTGVKGSKIIDDSYNSSPKAVISALNYMYTVPSDQKIAVLGTMNELGNYSADEHRRVGEHCNSNILDWVVTVGDEAEQFLVPAAKAKGCQVKSFKTAIEAGGFVNSVLGRNALVLFKGSQDKVFLEEAIKIILSSTKDEVKLVRQSPEWLKRKSDYFTSQIGINKVQED